MSKFIARVNPLLFAAAHDYVAVHDVRYYLSGVSIEPHPVSGVFIVATNGHSMIVIHDEAGYCDGKRIVRITDASIVRAMRKPSLPSCCLYISEKACFVSDNHANDKEQKADKEPDFFDNPPKLYSTIELIEGKFPAWGRIILTNSTLAGDHSMPPISAKYLIQMAKTAQLLSGRKESSVHTYAGEKNQVVTFRMNNPVCSDVLVCIMPLSDSDHYPKIPESFERARLTYDREQKSLQEDREQETQERLKPKVKPRMRLIDGEWTPVEVEHAQ